MKKNLGKQLVTLVTVTGMTYGSERRVVWDIDGRLFIKYAGKTRPVIVSPDTGTRTGFHYEATI